MRCYLQNTIGRLGAVALAWTIVSQPAAAGEFVSLSHLAPQLGYTYTWIASESAVALSRPGVYVLVRAGNPLYDVNDSVESTSDLPRSHDNDVYVGATLAARLRSLAVKPLARVERGVADQPDPAPAPSGSLRRGALTVTAAPTNTSAAVDIAGSGPANLPLTITLSADISRDLPRVVLSRTTVETDAAGRYAVRLSTAPLYLTSSLLLISASSTPGIAEAHTSLVLAPPSAKLDHAVDELPRDFRPH